MKKKANEPTRGSFRWRISINRGWIKRQRPATSFIQGDFLTGPSLFSTEMKKKPMGQPEALLDERFQSTRVDKEARTRHCIGFVCEAPGNGDGCCSVQCLWCEKLLILTRILCKVLQLKQHTKFMWIVWKYCSCGWIDTLVGLMLTPCPMFAPLPYHCCDQKPSWTLSPFQKSF